MDNRFSNNRELLIPILVGGISLLGIVVVLMVGRALSAPAQVDATPSATPFKYVYLGTEPAITTLVVEGSELPLTDESATEPPVTESSGIDTPNNFPTLVILPTRTSSIPRPTTSGPPIILPTNTSSIPRTNTSGPPVSTRTSTATRAATATKTNTPGAENTYDDTDPRLTYSPGTSGGKWTVQTGLDSGGPNPIYNGTLHISDVADGKSVTIQFTGLEFYFYYQSAPSYGIVTIYLDNDPLALTTVNESQGGVWHYVLENSQTHTLTIAHTGGGAVNIDKFVIPGATPTPTRTPTP